MLSIEKPPPDPPCPCEISQQKSSDEKASESKLALQEVDLFKSGLDDKNPLPKFSIRNYVFGSRRKDITANWPFSEKNLQLCLKHGVADPLPPFQPHDSVSRIQSVKEICTTIENSMSGQETIICQNDELSRCRQGDQFVSVTSNTGLGLCKQNLEVESVPTNSSPCSVEKIQPSLKKCKLIVKLSNTVDSNTNEDITAVNNYMASESIASKLCPVCKAFSSSSNTTLNAHIDQCLSGESTMKWTADSKAIKHINRIKPRKTRLMVDIYETAPYCTLEELDRRNGTNWATNSNFPVVEEIGLQEQRLSTVNLEDTDHEGAVYIDTNGKKVRILSKFDDVASVSRVGDDCGPQKPMKGEKESKFSLTKKRKTPHGQKQQKFLKLAPHSKTFISPNPSHNFEIHGCEERNFAVQQNCEKEEQHTQRCKDDREQTKLDDLGSVRRGVRSKRTALVKKTGKDDYQQFSRYNATKDLLVDSDQSSLGDSYIKRSSFLKTPNSSDNPICSPESRKRMKTSSYEPQVGNYTEKQPPFKKTVGFSSPGSQTSGYGKRSLILPKRNSKQLGKEGNSMHDSRQDRRNHTEDFASSLSNKAVEMNAGPAKNSDATVMSSEPPWGPHAIPLKGRRFSSLRKNLLSDAKFSFKRKCSALKKSRVHSISKRHENVVVRPPKVDESSDMMKDHAEEKSRTEEIADKMSLSRTSFFKIRKKRAARTSRKEEPIVLKCTPLSSQCYDTFDDEESSGKEVQNPGDHMPVEGSFMGLSESLDPEYDLQRRMEDFQGHFCGDEGRMCSTEPSLGDKKQMFSADEVVHDGNRQNSHMAAELDSINGQRNYFSEVDAISIPGPPGSFLPSLEDMGSEDLQGNSSLTTSRVHSSEDHHVVDRNSSDSPVSATSTISNPTFARSDSSRSSEKLPVGPHAKQGEIRPDFSGAGISQDELRVNAIFPEKRPLSLKNDQRCCCSRKEGASHGVASNFQESQLLRRRTTPLPASKRLSTLNSSPQMFSLNNYSISRPENDVLPAIKSSIEGHVPIKVLADTDVKFPVRGDCDSASPSASNPVLRLMGKNLMVVNKDENRPNVHPNPQIYTTSGLSTGNVQNEDYCSFRQVVSQSPSIFGQSKHDTVAQPFEVGLPNNFRSHTLDFKTPQEVMFLERQDYKGGYSLPTEQNRPDIRLDGPLTYDMEKVVTSPRPPMKEIIIIDDTHGSKADAMYSDVMRSGVSSSGISVPVASEYHSRHANPFYGSSPYCGSPAVHNASLEQPPSRGVNASPVKWNCTTEGPSAVHPSSLSASSSSTVPPRSILYYSSSFS